MSGFMGHRRKAHRTVVGGGGGFDLLPYSPSIWLSDTGSDDSEWTDLSGNARNVTQATSTRRPSIVAAQLNGRQIRRFDGADDKLNIGSSMNFAGGMIFLVIKLYTLKTYGVMINSSGNNGLHSNSSGIYGYGAQFTNCRINGGAEFTMPGNGAGTTNYFSDWCLFSAKTPLFSFDYMGYDGSFAPDADYAEFAGFLSGALPTETERGEIEAGMMAKYAL
jgi:hypothetical protein